jgi:hypothetical protein
LAELASGTRSAERTSVHVQPRCTAGRENAGPFDMDWKILDRRFLAGGDHIDGELGTCLREGRFRRP